MGEPILLLEYHMPKVGSVSWHKRLEQPKLNTCFISLKICFGDQIAQRQILVMLEVVVLWTGTSPSNIMYFDACMYIITQYNAYYKNIAFKNWIPTMFKSFALLNLCPSFLLS